MKRIMSIAGLVVLLATTIQTARAELDSFGSALYPWNEELAYVCRVTQSEGAADYSAFPGGKATTCAVNDVSYGLVIPPKIS